MSEGFLLDGESIDVLQRLTDEANLSRDLTTPSSIIANPAVPITVFVSRVMTQKEIEDLYVDVGSLPISPVNKFYNGYQVVWDGAAWTYKKGGAVFGNDPDIENNPFFDGPKIRTLTVPDLDQLEIGKSITELEGGTVYVAYPTYSTGRPTVEDTALESTFGWNAFVSQPIIYMIDTPYDYSKELDWLCHIDRTGNNINVNTDSLVGDPGATGIPLSEYLITDSTGFICKFLDLDKDKLFTDVTDLSNCITWDGATINVDEDCILALINIGCGLSGTGTVLDPFIINNLDLIDADGGLGVGDGTCDLQLDFNVLVDGDLTTRVDFAFFDGDLGVHHKSQFRDEGGYVTLNNQLLAHNSAEDFVWIDGDEAINLTGNTINVLHRFSIDRDVGTNSLEFVNDVDAPGNNFFYGTDDVGTKNWIDFDDLAGVGINFGNFDFNLDIMELATAVPNVTLDFFSFGTTLGADNEKANLNSMMDAVLETVTVITDIELDGSNNLRIKTTAVDVYNPGTESAFSTVTGWTTSDCP